VKGSLHIDVAHIDLASPGDLAGPPPFGKTFKGEPLYTLNIANPTARPSCFYMPNAPYTDEARRAQISGLVVVEAIIGTDGHLSDLRIIRGLPGLNGITLSNYGDVEM
jgi:outer membrane biosynthesis protein TonB